jgi:tRNA G10  N-methylase Trm11
LKDILLAICRRDIANEVIAAECENLTGGKPNADGVATCSRLDLIYRAAYIRYGIRCIARAENLDGLLATIAQSKVEAEDFRIEIVNISRQERLPTRATTIAIANALQGCYPDLENPKHRFLMLYTSRELIFGEILTEPDHSYQKHDGKPYRTSCSLPSQLARAIINLVIPPARSILNPCCGTGSFLLEARSLGLAAFGADWNPRMVGMSRKNLAHFGYQAEVDLLDARNCQSYADALVADLPYGKILVLNESVIRGILENSARLCPVAVIVAGADISTWMELEGYRDIEVFRVSPRKEFTRFIHRGQSTTIGS